MPLFNNVLAGAAGQSGGATGYTIERSLRFDSSSSSYLNRTPSSAGNRKTWTWSGWLKRNKTGHTSGLLGGASGSNTEGIYITNADEIYVPLAGQNHFYSPSLRDLSAWYHIVVAVDTTQGTNTNRIKTYINGVELTSDDVRSAGWPSQNAETAVNNTVVHTIGRNAGNAGSYGEYYLTEVNFVDGQQLAATDFGEFDADTGVWSPRKFSGTYGNNGFHLDFADASDLGGDAAGSNNWTVNNITGSVSNLGSPNLPGWGNPDSYWNLSDQVSGNYLTATYSGSGIYKGVTSNTLAANTTYHFFLEQYAGSGDYYGGWFFVDASSAPSNTVPDELGGDTLGQRVGETHAGYYGNYATANGGTNGQDKIDLTSIKANTSTGAATFSEWVINTSVNKVWVRAVGASGWIGGGDPATTSSTPSFNLTNASNKRFGYMAYQSGTYAKYLSSIGSASDVDSLLDSPTNYDDGTNIGGNFCVWNSRSSNSSGVTISNGNLDTVNTGSSYDNPRATFGMSSGSWYWEATITSFAGGFHVGLATPESPNQSSTWLGNSAGEWAYGDSGQTYAEGSASSYGSSFGNGAVIGVAFDADAGTVTFYKDGVSQGTAFTGLTNGPYLPALYARVNSTGASWNFGQRAYKYPPGSSGGPAATFKALCTQNLPDPEILDGSAHFTPLLYTGNSGLRRVGGPVYSSTSTLSSPTNVFNGDTSNGGVFNSTGNSVLTAGSITIESSLEIYHNRTGSDGITVNINGTDYTATGLSSTGYHTIPIPSSALPLTTTGNITIKDNASNGSSTCYAVRVDGIIVGDGTGVLTKFKPDLAWLKSRSTGRYHFWHDSVRGSTKALYSNNADVEYDYGTSGVTAFHNDGLTVNGGYAANYTNETYVAWLWNGGDLATISSSSYNQSRTWSDNAVGGRADEPIEDLFDGLTSTFAQNTAGVSNPNNLIVNFSPGLAYASSVEVYPYNASSVAINNGSQNSTTNQQWNTVVSGSGTLTKLDFQRNHSNGAAISAIRVDGKILINPGVVPVGSLNSTVYNTSQNWSVSGSNMQNNWSASFDGKRSPSFALPNTGHASTMTFASAISYQTLELIVSRDLHAPDLLLNGVALNVPKTDTNTSLRYQYERYYFTNGTLTSIGHETRNTAGQGGSGFWQIIVDGKILVDTNQASSVPNIPAIATTCTADKTAGFGISTYKGNSVDGSAIAHNLGNTPEMIIVKARDKSDDWRVYHVGAGNPYYLRLQLTNGRTTTNNWREQSLNYFSLDADSAVNSSSYNYVAYLFSSVEGYSLVSSYQGQNSFVYCGFRPQFLLIKSATSTEHWAIYDTTRSPSNHADDILKANSSDDEDFNYGSGEIDILSNGFKLIGNWGAINHGSTPTYVFLAIAENPFKYARAA